MYLRRLLHLTDECNNPLQIESLAGDCCLVCIMLESYFRHEIILFMTSSILQSYYQKTH